MPDDLSRLPPKMAAFVRRMSDDRDRQDSQLRALASAYKKLRNIAEQDRLELKRLADWAKKAAHAIKSIEDIPGKRVPYLLNFEIVFPGPTVSTDSIVDQRILAVQNISTDGPFVATVYMAAFRMRTFSLGETADRPNDPAAGAEFITPLTGRFRPIASTCDEFKGAYVGARVGGVPIADFSDMNQINTFRPGTIDFLWEVSDGGVDRNRQNDIASPSRFLFTECERPYYLPVSDFFERGSQVKVAITPTRDPGFVEVNYVALPGGFAEGANAPIDPLAASGRVAVSIGGTLTFTMAGYKILQAQSPAI